MNNENTAENLIASRALIVTIDPQNGWYLKQYAALQFEGSIDNFSTRLPIHVLEEQCRSDTSMRLDDAISEYIELDTAKLYDGDNNDYDTVSELIQTRLDLDDDEAIAKHNSDPSLCPFIPYEDLMKMEKNERPEQLQYVSDEAEYVDAYSDETGLFASSVTVIPMTNHYTPIGYAFTHQALEEYKDEVDNHIFNPFRFYAHAGEERSSHRVGDYYPIMESILNIGEQLLRQDLRRYDVQSLFIRTPDEMDNFFRTQPNEMILAGYLEVVDKVSNKFYSKIRIWCCGHEETYGEGKKYISVTKHYLTVDKGDGIATFPYPFSCDGSTEQFFKENNGLLSPAERLFCWTEYKNPNPINIKESE